MYPRLNPKTNNYRSKVKNSLNIIPNSHDEQRARSYRQDYRHGLDQTLQKVIKVKTIADDEQNQQKIRFNRHLSKQQNRYSVCLNQLPEKFNHLRGKRRSLQMALMMYQQIENQQRQHSFQNVQSSRKKLYSFQKLNHDQNKKKEYFSKVKLNKFLENQQNNQKILKYESQYKLIQQQLQNPLKEINPDKQLNRINFDGNRNNIIQEYNFIPKPVKKKSFFKNKIMEQILQNNIDKWQNQDKNDDNEFNLQK